MEARAPRSRDERNKQTALYHANLLQQQKDTELRNLESLENLIDLPTSRDANPATPSTEDARMLKEALHLFQPSDYDALIEERNINRSCGYALCPRPNKLLKTSAKRLIVRDGGKAWDPLKSVTKKALEHWCSDECGKRALFLKVQLSEKPAWERVGGSAERIILLDEKKNGQSHDDPLAKLAAELEQLRVESGEDKMLAAMRELAIERGDSKAGNHALRSVNVDVKEKLSVQSSTQLAPQLEDVSSGQHDLVEGYRPRTTAEKARERLAAQDNSDDDDENDISNLLHYG